jgi:hypothetical protein
LEADSECQAAQAQALLLPGRIRVAEFFGPGERDHPRRSPTGRNEIFWFIRFACCQVCGAESSIFSASDYSASLLNDQERIFAPGEIDEDNASAFWKSSCL